MHINPTTNQAAEPSAVQSLPLGCSGCSVITGLVILLQDDKTQQGYMLKDNAVGIDREGVTDKVPAGGMSNAVRAKQSRAVEAGCVDSWGEGVHAKGLGPRVPRSSVC
jgi:hypothetical protein